MYPKIHNRIGKVCALVAATLTLPVLAYADSGKGSKGDKDEHRSGDHDKDRDKKVPVVPETSAAWVLIPFFGAVLLFSWRQLSRSQA
jgi:hypothetical protein